MYFCSNFRKKVQILKTTNGVNWFILPDTVFKGTSSRAMVIQKGKVYVSTIDEVSQTPTPLLYSSKDPEFYPWESLIDLGAPGFDTAKNPNRSISNMEVFKTGYILPQVTSDGAEVWRTNGPEPKLKRMDTHS